MHADSIRKCKKKKRVKKKFRVDTADNYAAWYRKDIHSTVKHLQQ